MRGVTLRGRSWSALAAAVLLVEILAVARNVFPAQTRAIASCTGRKRSRCLRRCRRVRRGPVPTRYQRTRRQRTVRGLWLGRSRLRHYLHRQPADRPGVRLLRATRRTFRLARGQVPQPQFADSQRQFTDSMVAVLPRRRPRRRQLAPDEPLGVAIERLHPPRVDHLIG